MEGADVEAIAQVIARLLAQRQQAQLAHLVGGGHLGLARMNVADDRAFVDTAIALGNDSAALQALRAELAQRRVDSGLFDMAGFASDFSAALETMARERGWQGAHTP